MKPKTKRRTERFMIQAEAADLLRRDAAGTRHLRTARGRKTAIINAAMRLLARKPRRGEKPVNVWPSPADTRRLMNRIRGGNIAPWPAGPGDAIAATGACRAERLDMAALDAGVTGRLRHDDPGTVTIGVTFLSALMDGTASPRQRMVAGQIIDEARIAKRRRLAMHSARARARAVADGQTIDAPRVIDGHVMEPSEHLLYRGPDQPERNGVYHVTTDGRSRPPAIRWSES